MQKDTLLFVFSGVAGHWWEIVNEKLTVMYLSSRHLVSCPDPKRERFRWHPADSLGLLSPDPLLVGGVWDHQTPLCLRQPHRQIRDHYAQQPIDYPKPTLSVYRKQYTPHIHDQIREYLEPTSLTWRSAIPPLPLCLCSFSVTDQLLLLIAFSVCAAIYMLLLSG